MRALPLPGRRWLWTELGLVLAFGLFLRLLVLGSPAGTLNADEALTGLTAKQIVNGRPWLIVPGQHYGGTAESYLIAPLYLLFGTHPWAVKVVPIASWLACSALVFLIARPFGTRAALLLASLHWVFSGSMVLLSTLAYQGYGLGEVASLAALWLLRREVESAGGAERRNQRLWAGLLAGLALWQHPIQVAVLLPAFGFVALQRRRELWQWAQPTVLGGLVGLAPWIGYTLAARGASLAAQPTTESTYVERLIANLTDLLPRTIGTKALTGDWVGGLLGLITTLLLLLTLLESFVILLRRPEPAARLIGVVGLVAPLILSLHNGAWFMLDARYGILLVPFLLLGPGLVLAPRIERLARRRLVIPVVVVLWSLMTVFPSLDRIDVLEPAFRPESDLEQVIATLDRYGVHEALADYWLAYRIGYRTDQRIDVTPGIGVARFPEDQPRVLGGSEKDTLIFFSGSDAERASRYAAGREPIVVPVAAPVDPYHWRYAEVAIYLPDSLQTAPAAQVERGAEPR
jgi:hypothetical protein